MSSQLDRLDDKLRDAHIARQKLESARAAGEPLPVLNDALVAVQEAEASYADAVMGQAPLRDGDDLIAATNRFAAMREEHWYGLRDAAVERLRAATERVDDVSTALTAEEIEEYRAAQAGLEVFDGPSVNADEGLDSNDPSSPAAGEIDWEDDEPKWRDEPTWGADGDDPGWSR